VITNDWEVFGDGSGDYFELQQRPLQALLRVIEEHGAKITVMAEVGQQWAHQRIADREPWASDITSSWEAMLRDAVQRKFDVQLHLHPQWLNAEYLGGKWQVSLDDWSTGGLTPAALRTVLGTAKRYLEALLTPICPSYECVAFRAGSYCIEPSKHVIKALLETGLVCDSSVTKGFCDPLFYDFRDAFSHFLPWITTAEDVKYRADGASGLLELPICSYPSFDSPLLRKLVSPQLFYLLFFGVRISEIDRKWLASNKQSTLEKYPPNRRPFLLRKIKSVSWIFSNLLSKTAIQLDYDCLPPKVFVKCLLTILSKCKTAASDDVTIPIVVSGHTKNMHSPENIARILEAVQTTLNGQVVYWTLKEAIEYWTNNMQRKSLRVAL
jgi:hypothetical protein